MEERALRKRIFWKLLEFFEIELLFDENEIQIIQNGKRNESHFVNQQYAHN